MIYNDPYIGSARQSGLLDRRVHVDRRALEIGLYVVFFIASIVLHLWQLDVMAMHHDESIHAWISYRFFNGSGPFNCAGGRQADTYCYDPVYHGPALYVLTALSYFLFGAGDAQARLPMALAGIGLVPMAWTLRSFIGRKGALIAAALMTISPSLLYYTRFARHDALVLLWSLFMLVGIFRFLREGKAINLSIALAGIALTWASHELVFILLFIGGSFFLFRSLWEWRPRLFGISLAAAIVFMVAYVALDIATASDRAPALHSWLQRMLGPVLLLGIGAMLMLPMSKHWEPTPVARDRLVHTWQHDRRVFWIAGATFLVIFGLLFSTFLAYPRGFLDGWYQGIKYWLGSQHEYARGDQPWFYYLMLLPLYDLLAMVFSLIGLAWLMFSNFDLPRRAVTDTVTTGDGTDPQNGKPPENIHSDQPTNAQPPPLMVFFLGYWFVQSLIAFSWAGEKMPWLLTHISLPATLLAAWVLGRLIDRVPWRSLRHNGGWAVPLLSFLLALLLGVAAYSFAGVGETVAGVASRVRGIVPLIFAGLCLFGLLSIAGHLGGRMVWRLAALTLAAVLVLYGIRTTTLVVYRHPDVPIDPLIYTQTAPEVPLLVDQIERIAMNQTRTQRTAEDPTGSFSMPIVIDGGASQRGGEGNLAWPLQWYLRDFRNVTWLDVDTRPIDPEARVVVLYKPHLTDEIQSQLDDDFVQTSSGVFNWWFPEQGESPARGYKTLGREGVGAVLAWPFRPSNWPTLWNYMLYRELPRELNGREMVVFMHRDVVPGGGAAVATSTETTTVQPEATLAQGQIANGRGMAVDGEGNIYVADAGNHQIVVLDPSGEVIRTIGSFGNAPDQFYEPSGVSVDTAGNVYVADTWNSRIAKFAPDGTFITSWGSGTSPFGDPVTDPQTGGSVQRFATDTGGDTAGNAANPLGFFGPRNVLVSGDRVYIADTGNARIVVTDLDGTVVQQFGTKGEAVDQLREPIGLGVDGQGRLYVGDTWNGRIQIFQANEDGVDPMPLTSLSVSGWAANSYNDPYLAVAADGRVWASQGARNTLAEYDPAGQLVRRLRGDPAFAAPKGLALAPDGALYVVDSEQQQVVRIRP